VVVSDRYADLVGEFPLRPLRTKADYRRAGEVLDRLATAAEGSLSRGEQDYLETLILLVEDYDRRHRPAVDEPDPIAVLRHLMEANDMTVSDLGELLGSKGNASEILSGKRSLSKAHLAALSKRFAVNVSLFFPRA
jgi:HTH-type transcriptional regulator/antitoxin HigA